ncbi:hypothetical protein PMAC_000712 [Pneumocystis sp. 'macacae']|nr:hypothetical protein PMAC_000712 [Pneumocystis sp. 'macacae']
MKIIPLEILKTDNYSYIIICDNTQEAAIVDPAEPEVIIPYLEKLKKDGKIHLSSIITTHHHYDHAGGNKKMIKKYKDIKVYGGCNAEGVNYFLKDGEMFKIGEVMVKSLHTPCHTRDSICYFVEDRGERAVFTGDTLFNGGCDKLSEVSKFVDNNKITCGMFTIDDEKTYNPFMMVDSIEIQKATGESDSIKVMAKLRELKNRFQ